MDGAWCSTDRKCVLASESGGDMGVPTDEAGGDCSIDGVSKGVRPSSSGV